MSIYDMLSEDRNKKTATISNGVALGVVTNNKDPEKLGRIKVKLHAFEPENNETGWIRVLCPYGGKERGIYFLPEVGDEVLIAFAGGDASRPYVLGVLWNSKDVPPATNEDGKNTQKIIKTKNGSKIVFTDSDGSKEDKIEIITPKGHTIQLADAESGEICIKDKDGKNQLDLKGSGEITITGEKNITVKAGSNKIVIDGNSNNVTIESGAALKIKAQQIEIQAGASMKIKSAGMLDISSDGIVNIKGSMVKIN